MSGWTSSARASGCGDLEPSGLEKCRGPLRGFCPFAGFAYRAYAYTRTLTAETLNHKKNRYLDKLDCATG